MIIRKHIRRELLAKLYLCHPKASSYRKLCSRSSAKLVSLTNRSIINVSGKDSTKLLQGLVTNDLKLLHDGTSSVYSMLLNTNGRIVYDLMLYRGKVENEYLIECDGTDDESLIQLMKKYKLRSKVYFEKRPDLNLSCIFLSSGVMDDVRLQNLPGCFKDPRLAQCGVRVLSHSTDLSNIDHLDLEHAELKEYKEHRYNIGISEGSEEVSNGIPLEHNLAWLNGVSFNKGCYIGQELVARTHHVGVIRKRIMPLQFPTEMDEKICGEAVVNEKGKRVGKIIGVCGKSGIGLMRLKEVELALQLHVNIGETAISLSSFKPDWWPFLE